MARLTWSGNLKAQREADKAYARLKPKRKRRKTKKERRRLRLQRIARRKARGIPTKTKRRKFVDYAKYIQSPKWKRIRAAAIARADFRCENCLGTYRLEVDHLTYERLGDELPTDLKVLCHECHADRHLYGVLEMVDWQAM